MASAREDVGRRTERELRVMMVLAAGPRHGYGIMKDITEGTGGRIRMGSSSLYSILDKFTARGYIEECSSTPVPAEPTKDSRRRRYFCLTELGRDVASREVEWLESLAGQARRAGLVPEERYEREGEKREHLLGLDEEPVHAGAPDGSENLDRYVYGSP
ncbi:MAG: PadR family transcriptional regulator [Rubrobacteraceae bacterium]